MKLSALIHYRNLLEDYTPKNTSTVVQQQVGHALHLIQENQLQFADLTQTAIDDYDNIGQAFDTFTATIQNIQKEIRNQIDTIEPEYFKKSYQVYAEAELGNPTEALLDRRLNLSDNTIEYLHNRVRMYGNWRHAGMIIRPGKEPWTNDLVACDPLYLVDQNLLLLNHTLDQYHEQYKNRLRIYTVKESIDSPLIPHLPDNQFGFCLVYNFFNYRPLEIVKIYLLEIYNKLKPGGIVAFTINNCDLANGVELAERTAMSYTPFSLIMSLCENIGYSMVIRYQLDSTCIWIEMMKSGTSNSLRGGQNLARIVAKSK